MEKKIKYKCPICEEEIKELEYYVGIHGSEFGRAILSETSEKEIDNYNFYDNGDLEWSEKPTYKCIECGEEIEINDLITKKEKKEKKIEPILEKEINIIRPEMLAKKNYNTPRYTTCKNCGNTTIETRDTRDTCIICNQEIN